ncbi:MAG: TrkA C-terminal domain-containing protein [Candidatus Aerophobetes bacterium]|nr:TrkA C-terminal domain-containing protein [Candidatus Aerophobetes bacterium]
MGGIILIVVVVLISVMIRKVATVALKLTGLDEQTASFQALSALTGTGFTTREAELMLSHPMRRKVISLLMIIGNVGLVAIIAGLVSSFLTITSFWAIFRFVILIVALYLIFKMATYTRLARFLSRKIEKKLQEKFKLQKRSIEHILDLEEDFGIAEVTLHKGSSCAGKTLASSNLNKKKILILAIERDKERILVPRGNHKLRVGDNLICYGSFTEMKEIS